MLKDLLTSLGVYKIYGRWLKSQVKSSEMPRHIGIILDGNRRWARGQNMDPWEGHWAGGEHVKAFLEWCINLNISTVTLYAFSTENFKRSEKEVEELMKVYEKALRDVLASDVVNKYQVRVTAIGRRNLLPENIQKLIAEVEQQTKGYDKFYLSIALAYGGRAEIVDATRELAELVKEGKLKPEEIDEELIEKHLYTKDLPQQEPDLIIRTGNESRLSNFLLWQAAYSELFIVDVYWPEFREIDLQRVIRNYQLRNRRYGK
ncbi:MAG: polyprenyl diphosphate synthase [Candidatus Bathyarchaeia archaeon]|jgi:tritrans,polycis-undecaprenyl-diphosphate synthase [geranylgeranyl-diphosphate specific]